MCAAEHFASGVFLVQCQGEGVLTHHTNGRQANIDANRSIMAIGEEQIGLKNIIATDANIVWKLGKKPNDFPTLEIPTGVIYRLPLSQQGIKHLRTLTILQGLESWMHNAHNSVRLSGLLVLPNDSHTM
jgi:hypothetical protein